MGPRNVRQPDCRARAETSDWLALCRILTRPVQELKDARSVCASLFVFSCQTPVRAAMPPRPCICSLVPRPPSAIRLVRKAREFHGSAPAVQAILMRRCHGSRRSCLPRTSANRRRCLSRSPQAQARIIGRGAIVRRVVHVLVGSTTVNSLRYSCCVGRCGTSAAESFTPSLP